MLIDFSVTNYRSIKDKQTFSMQPIKRIDELPEHIIQNGKHSALSSAIIYGRNASGKSNLLKAMNALAEIISESSENKVDEVIKQFKPYKLSKNSEEEPIQFEINFIAHDNIHYYYQITFSQNEILQEVLLYYPNGRESNLFIRNVNRAIIFGKNVKGRNIEESLYNNQSFLSKIGSNKLDSLIPAYHFLSSILFKNQSNYFIEGLVNYLTNKKNNIGSINPNLISLLKIADTNIVNLIEEEREDKDLVGNKIMRTKLFSEHNIYDNDKVSGSIFFDFGEESEGTQRLVSIGSQILNILNVGGIIIIDEFHESLHPLLTKTLINLFHNPKTNPNGAQLIFATHDVSLLDNDLFRRDQIWFSEKGNDGASTYYSLADLKGIRAGVPLEKYYLKGAFGATPIINEHDLVFNFGEKNEQK